MFTNLITEPAAVPLRRKLGYTFASHKQTLRICCYEDIKSKKL